MDWKVHRNEVAPISLLPPVAVLILNWNGWKDTIECLESIFRLSYPQFSVVVCDNASSDGSLEKIAQWANGDFILSPAFSNPLGHLSFPPVKKKIPFKFYTRKRAEEGGEPDDTTFPLILIQTGKNLGFAGGNNVGISFILSKSFFPFIWLLNNDVVVEPDSLNHLVDSFADSTRCSRKVGLLASKLLYYDHPTILQGVGGIYNKCLGTAYHLGEGAPDRGQFDCNGIENLIDYPIGASLFVSSEFALDVGPLSEEYFLYFEELDWVLRGKIRGWEIGYSWLGKVFHKEGAAAGSSANGKKKSRLADFFSLRNRLLFTKKFFPSCYLTVFLGLLLTFFNRLRRFQFDRLMLVLQAAVNKPILPPTQSPSFHGSSNPTSRKSWRRTS